MYELTQHVRTLVLPCREKPIVCVLQLIHMIAGKEVLAEYMSTKPKEDVVHPASVIRDVLKGQINENGKTGYEHKVGGMWHAFLRRATPN